MVIAALLCFAALLLAWVLAPDDRSEAVERDVASEPDFEPELAPAA